MLCPIAFEVSKCTHNGVPDASVGVIIDVIVPDKVDVVATILKSHTHKNNLMFYCLKIVCFDTVQLNFNLILACNKLVCFYLFLPVFAWNY